MMAESKKIKQYVIVGTGHRGLLAFGIPLTQHYGETCRLTGVFDINPKRAAYFSSRLAYPVKVYQDFDGMLDEAKPDAVIVTTIDSAHHAYIIRAMEKGCDVICEKPLTIDEDKCRDIFLAHKAYGRDIRVTFNCRYMPYLAKIKELVQAGAIGKVLSVNYEYLLGFSHGADYFRRWHRRMERSGGMLLHKSTHHFDVVNWLLGDQPETVTAQGRLCYFGANRPYCGTRCGECAHTDRCEFYFDIEKHDLYNDMYHKTKEVDGYFRDGCVFDPQIDIYDNMSVQVAYKGGALLTYSLTMFNPYEGYKISLIGTEGRIEAAEHTTGLETDSVYTVKVIRPNNIVEHTFPKTKGAHSGSDDIMRDEIFKGKQIADGLAQRATVYDGAASLMIGACANKSIRDGKAVDVQQYLHDQCEFVLSNK